MSTTLDLIPVQRSRVVRSPGASVPLSVADKALGLRSAAEGAVLKAIKQAGSLRTEAEVVRKAGIPEIAAGRVLRGLLDRGLVRRSTNNLGMSAYVAAR